MEEKKQEVKDKRINVNEIKDIEKLQSMAYEKLMQVGIFQKELEIIEARLAQLR